MMNVTHEQIIYKIIRKKISQIILLNLIDDDVDDVDQLHIIIINEKEKRARDRERKKNLEFGKEYFIERMEEKSNGKI